MGHVCQISDITNNHRHYADMIEQASEHNNFTPLTAEKPDSTNNRINLLCAFLNNPTIKQIMDADNDHRIRSDIIKHIIETVPDEEIEKFFTQAIGNADLHEIIQFKIGVFDDIIKHCIDRQTPQNTLPFIKFLMAQKYVHDICETDLTTAYKLAAHGMANATKQNDNDPHDIVTALCEYCLQENTILKKALLREQARHTTHTFSYIFNKCASTKTICDIFSILSKSGYIKKIEGPYLLTLTDSILTSGTYRPDMDEYLPVLFTAILTNESVQKHFNINLFDNICSLKAGLDSTSFYIDVLMGYMNLPTDLNQKLSDICNRVLQDSQLPKATTHTVKELQLAFDQ